MELDFSTIKALSSPTRVRILSELLDSESTPTQLSDSLGKSKSTVSDHLKQLNEAGLLEKDAVEGRRRVVYRPTRKARTIVEGRERKVKFSLASSGLTAIAGAVLLGNQLMSALPAPAESADKVTAMTAQAPKAMASTGSKLPSAGDILLFAAVVLLLISLGTFLYGLLMRALG